VNVFISQFLQAAVIIFIYDQLIQKYDSDSMDKDKNSQENHLEKAIIFNFQDILIKKFYLNFKILIK
jgi:hypothetical protein